MTADLLRDCRRFVLAVLGLLEVEAQLRPERRTMHLVIEARELVARIDAELNDPRNGG
jgi:hypothetical protein